MIVTCTHHFGPLLEVGLTLSFLVPFLQRINLMQRNRLMFHLSHAFANGLQAEPPPKRIHENPRLNSGGFRALLQHVQQIIDVLHQCLPVAQPKGSAIFLVTQQLELVVLADLFDVQGLRGVVVMIEFL